MLIPVPKEELEAMDEALMEGLMAITKWDILTVLLMSAVWSTVFCYFKVLSIDSTYVLIVLGLPAGIWSYLFFMFLREIIRPIFKK